MTPQFIAHCAKLSDNALRAFACEVAVSNAARGHDISKDAKAMLDAWAFGKNFREVAMRVAYNVKV